MLTRYPEKLYACFALFVLAAILPNSGFGQITDPPDGGGSNPVSFTGPTNVNVNDYDYYYVTVDGSHSSSTYAVFGGTIVSQNKTSVRVRWTSIGTNRYIRVTARVSGSYYDKTVFVTVNSVPAPATPATPTLHSSGCGSSQLRRGSPPSGVTWYWQGTNSNGTSTSNSSTYYTVSSTGRYYLRARNSSGIWSSSSSSIYVTLNTSPPAPSTPAVTNNCGNSVLSRGNPPSGVTWYWQGTNSNGTSTANSSTTYTTTTSGTYYLRARNNAGGCWGAVRSVSVAVKTLPSIPPTPAVSNNCGSSVITTTTPPTGITWYWQGTNANGTSTSNSNGTYTVTAPGTYYLRARNNSTGCWGSSRAVAVTVNIVPSVPASPTVTSNCGNSVLTRVAPPPGIAWYWQGTNATGTSTSNANATYTVNSPGTYYLRGRSSSGCWSSSRSVTVTTISTVPGTPGIPSVSYGAVNATLTSGTPPSGVTWYWQGTQENGTNTTNSGTSYVVSTPGTYFLRARDNSSGCWGSSQAIATVFETIPPAPDIPDKSLVTGGVTLTRITPPQGITHYWQGTNPNGTNTEDSNNTYLATSVGTYYLRARNNVTGEWSANSSAIAVSPLDLGILESPTALLALLTDEGHISLTWSDNSGGEMVFEIERSVSQSEGYVKIAEVGANVDSYLDRPTNSDVTYYYRVRSRAGEITSGYSNWSKYRLPSSIPVNLDVDYSSVTVNTAQAILSTADPIIRFYIINTSDNVAGEVSGGYNSNGIPYAMIITNSYGEMRVPDIANADISFKVESNCRKRFDVIDKSFYYWLLDIRNQGIIATTTPNDVKAWYDAAATSEKKMLDLKVQDYGVADFQTLYNNCPAFLLSSPAHDPWSIVVNYSQEQDDNSVLNINADKLLANSGFAFKDIGRMRVITSVLISTYSPVLNTTLSTEKYLKCYTTKVTEIPAGEVSEFKQIHALKELYEATDGANWTNNTGWPSSNATWDAITSVGQITGWHGITTLNGDVTQINLSDNNLSGTVPTAIGDLQALTYLHLGANQLSGLIPAETGRLVNLRQLFLSDNAFTGEIPRELGNLDKLTHLYLSSNQLTGAIPGDLNGLTNVEHLHLSANQLSEAIPPGLGELPNLCQLFLHSNQLSGDIPETIGDLASLTHLSLLNNSLSGPIPSVIGNITSLQTLILADNNFSGPIPDEFSNLLNLRYFNLRGNDLTGEIPGWLGNLPDLIQLLLQGNRFNGSIPGTLGDLTDLAYLGLHDNNLSGAIPSTISNLLKLRDLQLQGNDLTGQLPAGLGNLTALRAINVSDNSLEGIIPAGLNNLPFLSNANFSYNQFTQLQILKTHPNRSNLNLNVRNNPIPLEAIEANLTGVNTHDFKSFTFFALESPDRVEQIFTNGANAFTLENDRGGGNHTQYQWQVWNGINWSDINGATTEHLDLDGGDPAIVGKKYRARMTNDWVTGQTVYSSEFEIMGIGDEVPVNYQVNALHNGTITSLQWRTDKPYGVEETDFEDNGWGAYLFDYDEKYQLKEALWGERSGSGVNITSNKYRLANLRYDNNGNIRSLRRYTAQGTAKHDFDYHYNSDQTRPLNNRLENIPGHASYYYNNIGELTAEDSEEGQDKFVKYDVTGKVVAIYAEGAHDPVTGITTYVPSSLKTTYTYDDRGFRLMKRNEETGHETWYIRDASGNLMSIYEKNGAEQAAVKTEVPVYGSGRLGVYYPQQDGTTAYELADHLGNVRAVMKRQRTAYTATMEDTGVDAMTNPRVEEMQYFENLFETGFRDVNHNHTDYTDASYASYLYWGGTQTITTQATGPSIGLRVEANDKIDLEVWVQYQEKGTNYDKDMALAVLIDQLSGTFTRSLASEAPAVINDMITDANVALLALPGEGDNTVPYAYLNYVLFDDNLVVADVGAKRVSSAASYTPGHPPVHEHLAWGAPLDIAQDGYLFVWVSNESPDTRVWFDDLTVEVERDIVTQATDYYPFGSVARRYNTPNNYFEPAAGGEISLPAPVASYIQEAGEVDFTTTTTTGHDGTPDGAMEFDGTTSVYEQPVPFADPDFIKASGIFTISAWVRIDDLSKDATIIGDAGFSASDVIYDGFAFGYRAGGYLRVVTSGYIQALGFYQQEFTDSDAGAITDTNWHHVAVTGDARHMRFYVDGQPVGQQSIVSNTLFPSNSDWPISVGAATVDYYGYEAYWDGALDDIQIFDGPLNSSQIKLLAGTIPKEPDNPSEDGEQFGQYYRWGFQGEFAEEDSETGWNSFELRMYDAVVGRWNSIDPYGQHFSPYLSMGNDPVNQIDQDGGFNDYVFRDGEWVQVGVTGEDYRHQFYNESGELLFQILSPIEISTGINNEGIYKREYQRSMKEWEGLSNFMTALVSAPAAIYYGPTFLASNYGKEVGKNFIFEYVSQLIVHKDGIKALGEVDAFDVLGGRFTGKRNAFIAGAVDVKLKGEVQVVGGGYIDAQYHKGYVKAFMDGFIQNQVGKVSNTLPLGGEAILEISGGAVKESVGKTLDDKKVF